MPQLLKLLQLKGVIDPNKGLIKQDIAKKVIKKGPKRWGTPAGTIVKKESFIDSPEAAIPIHTRRI